MIEEKKSTFEEDLARLTDITEKLKDQDIGLEESFALYEEANKLTKKLNQKLDEIERKVEEVTNSNEDEIVTRDFNAVDTPPTDEGVSF